MNTFNTTGFVSRNNATLNNKTNDGGLQTYYQMLQSTPGSISQLNHPGATFGNFADFGYHDNAIDDKVTLVEAGNGEGAIGSGGYFRSVDQFILALDKGWHVAPTNNGDNHKKGWGTSNTAATVVYTNDFTLSGIYTGVARPFGMVDRKQGFGCHLSSVRRDEHLQHGRYFECSPCDGKHYGNSSQ